MTSRCLVCLCFLLLCLGRSSAQRTDPISIAIALNASRDSLSLQKLIQNIIYKAQLSTTESKSGFYAATSLNLSEPCKSHYDFYNKELQSMQTWALTMSDSSTKFPPSSLLQGATTHLGNFDECIDIRDIKWTETSSFHGQHCLAAHKFKSKASSSRGAVVGMLMYSPLKMALCVPSTCNPTDTAIIAMDQFSAYEIYLNALGVELEVDVNEQDCHTADRPEFSSEDMIAASILAFFAGLVIFSTCYDIFTEKNESRSNLAIAFSVYTNGKKLLNTSGSSADTLHCLHGIRFLSMAWIILGHRYQSGITLPAINMRPFMTEIIESWWGTVITSATNAVDTFFLLSGLMVAYVFFRTVPKTNSFNIPMYYIHRYVRLTPALAIIIMLRSTLLTHSGSGPLWDATANAEKKNCDNYWWTNLLYVQNYVNPMELCISQGWYLAVDMQLYWLSPLLLVPLWKWPKVGLAMVGLLTAAGSILVALMTFYGDYPTTFVEMMSSPKIEDYQKNIYYPVYTRFVPYVVGIGLGYLLVDLKRKEWKVRVPKVVNLVLWIITAGLLVGTIAVTHTLQQSDFVANDAEKISILIFMRLMWSLGVAMVIFLCATGNGCFVNTILSWDWFQLLSRLTYSAYLVHISVQISQNGSLRTLSFLGDMTLFPQFLGDVMMTLVFSAMLCLVFESPFMILEKELLGGRKPATKPKDHYGISSEQRTEVAAEISSEDKVEVNNLQEVVPEIPSITTSEEKTEISNLQDDVPQSPTST
ncbi:nose resistant to fluoxetine protein 6 [Anabrus simplex]|uniref:nose resistant to fluoxetine protein 6 n=1 Tax=Anabrus simplex TaxID=316456 RepID=UPI0035A358CD